MDIRKEIAKIQKKAPSKINLEGITQKTFNKLAQKFNENFIVDELAKQSTVYAKQRKDYNSLLSVVKKTSSIISRKK